MLQEVVQSVGSLVTDIPVLSGCNRTWSGYVVMISLSQDKQTLITVFALLGLRSDSRDVYKQPRGVSP